MTLRCQETSLPPYSKYSFTPIYKWGRAAEYTGGKFGALIEVRDCVSTVFETQCKHSQTQCFCVSLKHSFLRKIHCDACRHNFILFFCGIAIHLPDVAQTLKNVILKLFPLSIAGGGNE